jgi:conjugal transfer pilus assembly protein TraV
MIKLKRFLNLSFYFYLGALSLWLSSCSVYNQQFDCPPPSGIPCTSVTEIESMIVETDKGPDLIIKPEVEEDHCFWCGSPKSGLASLSKTSPCNRKVWICSQRKEGCSLKGYYAQKSDVDGFYSNVVLEPEEIFTCQKKEN